MTRYAASSDFTAPPGHCRYCKKKVKPPKQSWCSQECVDEYLVRRSPTDARRAVFNRDGGVCSVCVVDTVALARTLEVPFDKEAYCAGRRGQFALGSGARMFDMDAIRRARDDRDADTPTVRAILGRLDRGSVESALWDMDHVVPVKDGGGGCGLDNLQTLCLWCHDRKTHRRDEQPGQLTPDV